MPASKAAQALTSCHELSRWPTACFLWVQPWETAKLSEGNLFSADKVGGVIRVQCAACQGT